MSGPLHSKNPLLVKDDVGRAKPSCYNLPGDDFAYGRPDLPDYEGAREVTMQWVTARPSGERQSDVQDFKKLNRAALKSGILNAKEQTKFRKNNPVQLEHTVPCAPPKIYPSEVVPSFTYGKKTRPSTPISQVISNQFGAEYESALTEMYTQYNYEKEMATYAPKIRTTKAVEGHAKRRSSSLTNEHKSDWKLSKFKNVKGRMTMDEMGRGSRTLQRAGSAAALTSPAAGGA
jgi:hypothetical protein